VFAAVIRILRTAEGPAWGILPITPMPTTRCPNCGALPPDGARFCPSCGRPLAVGDTAERKLATVLFADLAGSTELAASMDAETLRDLLGDVYDQLSRAAEVYGGTVEKFIGDAVMAVFGVPIAHEDDPERAVRAAIVMRSRLMWVAERRDMALTLRIGINTGLVATGTVPGRDFLVTGEAVNLAARLQQAAEPGEILLGERTFRAVEPLARTVAPRSLRVKGRAGPITAYAVERMAPAGSYRRRRRAFGPFVGREAELTLMRSLVERAVEHARPHLITIVGEPGIGKSRLLEEVVVELRRSDEPPAVWVGRCLPYGEAGPYAPLRDVLLRAAAVRAEDTPDEAIARVTGFLHALVPDATDEWIAELLRTVSNRWRASGDADALERDPQSGHDAWRQLLVAMAAREPTLLVIEDAHWAEPALLELVAAVIRAEARVPLVVLCLARDDLLVQHPGWGSGMRDETTVTLSALGVENMRRLATALGCEDEAGVALAGGNPFFLEEILAMTGEGGERVPETVQGVIAARIDLLPPDAKQVLQRASVIGRRFTQPQLAVLAGGADLGRTLRRLAERGLLFTEPGGRQAFKHALIRDVAYESIPRQERARLHLALGRSLESDPIVSRQTVANHYAAAAGLGADDARADAVRTLLAAAVDARAVYAHGLALRQATLAQSLAAGDHEHALAAEAIGDARWMTEAAEDAWLAYGEALEHAERAGLGPGDRARLRWKWADMPTRWGSMLMGLPGQGGLAEMIAKGIDEAREADLPAIEGRLLVASALSRWRYQPDDRAALEEGLVSGEAALAIGERIHRPELRSAAMDAIGTVLLGLGRYQEARSLADRRVELAVADGGRVERMDACSQAAQTRIVVADYAGAVAAGDAAGAPGGEDDAHWQARPVLDVAEAYFAWDRWDEALQSYDRYLALYRRSGGGRAGKAPARASGVAAAVHLLRGDADQAEELEQRLGSEPKAAFQLMMGQALLGRGEPELALDRVRYVDLNAHPVYRIAPAALAIRAEAAAAIGRWDEYEEALAAAAVLPGVGEMPRILAQLQRARGIAGDEVELERAAAAFAKLGCRFEHARCRELLGDAAAAREVYERLGAIPALERVGA
jgi:class 3 adenylate cyclase/tetratricopeptide (TPR) repeat protein